MLNLYFFFYLNLSFKPFFTNGRKYLYTINKFLYLYFLNYIINSKIKKFNIKFNIKLKKKFSRNYTILKAAFKHKVPKHTLKQNQSKLILKISFPFFYDNYSSTDQLSEVINKTKLLSSLRKNLIFLPSHLYRVKCEVPLKLDLNYFLNNF